MLVQKWYSQSMDSQLRVNRIVYINKRLEELRKDWKVASPSMKMFIERGAKVFKDELVSLEKRLEKEEQMKI